MIPPKVTVLMPVYNAEKYIGGAVDSILHQTFRDFELLIINDGSTDATQTVLESYTDPRIRIIVHKKNSGIVRRLNEGISLSKGVYIARMDADDVALPMRLEKQVAYMDKHPAVAVCGTWLKVISDTKVEIWKAPTTHDEIQSLMLFHAAIFHPTVIMRTKTIKRYNLRYSQSYHYSEDYELWVRIANYSRLANLPEVLLHRRINKNTYIDDYARIQVESSNAVRLRQIHNLGIKPTKKEFEVHSAVSNWLITSEKSFVTAAEKWLRKLIMANLKTKRYTQSSLAKVVASKWLAIRFRGIGL